jgi:hypothetical protein
MTAKIQLLKIFSLFMMTVSVCHTAAFGQTITGNDDERAERRVLVGRILMPGAATHPVFQNALRLTWHDGLWIRNYALLPHLLPLASIGRPTIFQPSGRGGVFQFDSGLSLTKMERYHDFGRFSLAAGDPLVSDNWKGGTGNWSLAANWSSGVPNNGTPPGTTYDVFIDHGNAKASVVTLDINAGINNLTIDLDDSLAIGNGRALTINGSSIANAGKLSLNSTGSDTFLIISAPNVTLSGGGTVTLSNNANNFIFGATTADTLTNQETIQGAIGNAQMTLVNSGTIDANQSAGMTIQANGGTTNTGTLEATAGATLDLTGMTVNNTGGTISANASKLQEINATINGGTVTLTGASTLQMTNGVIHGGSTLNNSSTGTIEMVAGNNTLGGTINNSAGGVVKIDNGALLELENGSYSKLGTVTLNSTGSFTDLEIGGANVTLSGGTVTLSNNANNFIFGATTADTLTNQETIQGAGHIGNAQMTLVNSGTIDANQSAGMTIQANGGTTNTGTLEATAGATLDLTGMTVNNTGGTISANGSKLQEINATINGGTVTLTGASTLQMTNGVIHNGSTLNNISTGTIEMVAGNNTLGGTINNSAGGVVKIDNGALLELENGSYSKLGTVTLNSTGSFTDLEIGGANVTLSGGTVTLSNNANNFIFGATSADILTNQETIQGAGHIGNAQMGLINSGTILANQSTALVIQPSSAGFTNNGILQVNSGDLMHVLGGPFTNFSGTTLTGGTYNVAKS